MVRKYFPKFTQAAELMILEQHIAANQFLTGILLWFILRQVGCLEFKTTTI